MRLDPRTASTLAMVRRNYRKNSGQTSYRAILGSAAGAISVIGEPQYYYVRLANGLNADGTTQYGAAFPVLAGAGYTGSEANGTPVIVGLAPDGQWAILQTDRGALIEQGLNPRAENPNSPYSKFVDLGYALSGYVAPIGTVQTVSLKVYVHPLPYIDSNGIHQTISGQLDLTANVPAADGDSNDMQLLAGVFVNSSNVLVAVTSTAKLASDTLSYTDVAEIIAAAMISAPRAFPLRYYKLTTGQTNITAADDFGDGRQWITVHRAVNYTTNIDDGDTPYTIAAGDDVLYCDTDGGVITANLPAGTEGQHYKIINCGSSGNDLTVDPNGTEQLYGAGAGVASVVADGEVIDIHYNATQGWW